MRKHAFLALAVFSALALYLPTLQFGFIGLDDSALVRYFRYYADSAHLISVFHHSVMSAAHIDSGHFRPVLETYWIITSSISNALYGAADPGVYHAGALVLHGIACMLLWRLMRRLGHDDSVATALTLLFAMHPAMASAVGWVCGCNESLFAIFTLLTFTCLHRCLQQESPPRAHALCTLAALVFLMICTKESAVLLLPMMLFLAPFPLDLPRARREHVIAFVLPVVAWWLLRSHALQDSALANAITPHDVFQCIITAAEGILLYAAALIAPADLPGIWPINDSIIMELSLMIIVIEIGVTAFLPPRLGFALCWFAACTLLTFMGNKDGVYILREDHVYTASLGLLIAIPPGLLHPSASHPPWRALALCPVIVWLAVQTHTHLSYFASSERYFTNVTQHDPRFAEGHLRLGDAYVEKPDFSAAQREYQEAAEINPWIHQVHNNLGVCWLRMGDPQRARMEFLRELELQPEWDVAWGNLGSAQLRLNEPTQAEQSFLRAVYHNHDNAPAYQNLAALYASRADMPKLQAVLVSLKRLQVVTD